MRLMTEVPPAPSRHPAECLACEVIQDGRRFCLVLVSSHYARSGVAVFTEVTLDNDENGEPLRDVFQDVGTWCIDPETDEGITQSVLKVDCLLPEDVARAAVMNALLRQIGGTWTDTWEAWS